MTLAAEEQKAPSGFLPLDKYVFVALVAAIPFASPSQSLMVRPIIPAALAVRYGAFILLLAWLWRSSREPRLSVGHNPLLLPLFALASVTTVSSFLTGDFHPSLYGDPKAAMHGLHFWASLVLMAFLASEMVLRYGTSSLEKVLPWVAMALGSLALLQHLGSLEPLISQGGRSYATLINPLELAGVLLLLFPLAVFRLTDLPGDKPLLNPYLLPPLFCFLGIYLTKSRIALAISLAFIAVLLLLWQEGRKRLVSLMIPLALSVGLLSFVSSVAIRDPGSVTVSGQLSSALPSLEARLATWEKGLQMFRDRPLGGWGDAQIADHFERYRDDSLSQRIGEKFSPFDMHNKVVQTLVSAGILGLLLLIWIAVLLSKAIAAAVLSFSQRAGEGGVLTAEKALAVALLSFTLFWLSSPSWQVSEVYFWVFSATLLNLHSGRKPGPELRLPSFVQRNLDLPSLAIVLILFFLSFSVVHAERLATLGVTRSDPGDAEYGVRLLKEAISLNPGEADYQGRLGFVYFMKGEREGEASAYQKSVEAYSAAIERSPRDPFRYERLASVYLRMREKGIPIKGDLEPWLERALSANPLGENIRLLASSVSKAD